MGPEVSLTTGVYVSNCNTWTLCFDFAVNVILRFQIDGSDRGSNFYAETKFMDFRSRWEENRDIREIKIHVYGKPLTSDSSWEFLKIENKKIKTVQNNSYG